MAAQEVWVLAETAQTPLVVALMESLRATTVRGASPGWEDALPPLREQSDLICCATMSCLKEATLPAEWLDVVAGRLIVIASGTPEETLSAMACGAVAVVRTDRLARDLPEALTATRQGMAWLPASSLPGVARLLRSRGVLDDPRRTVERISVRERDVLTLAARGYSNQDIAERLRISVKTVETYKHRVKLRFNLTARGGIIAVAEREGLLGHRTPAGGQIAVPPPGEAQPMVENDCAD